jgi:protein-tyrosine-phosphatase
MAEGLLRDMAGDLFEVESAGIDPTSVRPEAIAAMKEIGIDISSHRSKSVDEFLNDRFDYVITVCDNANESCPMLEFRGPGRRHRERRGANARLSKRPRSNQREAPRSCRLYSLRCRWRYSNLKLRKPRPVTRLSC